MSREIESKVLQALRTVQDPDLNQDLVALKMITDLEISETKISFTIKLTTPACPLKEVIKSNCIAAIHGLVCMEYEVIINFDAEVTSSARKNLIDLPSVKNVIAIASGKGGVGKSTVASNLAVSLAMQGANVGLLDADIFGPSIPTMFSCEKEKPRVEKIDGKSYMLPVERYGVRLMSIGLLTAEADSSVVWRGPMASKVLKQLLADTLWGEIDYLLVDLPPGTSDIHITICQAAPLTGAVVVTTPQRVATMDAGRAIEMFTKELINVKILGIIENMSYYLGSGGEKIFPFGKDGGAFLAERYQAPLLGRIPLDPIICSMGDLGKLIVLDDESYSAKVFLETSQLLAQGISIANISTTKKTNN